MSVRIPRLVIAGLSGDSGKTIVSLSLSAALWRRQKTLASFKKGPDYIDAAWLTRAAGRPCRNLDTYLVKQDRVCQSFIRHSSNADLAVIEGNRGLYDGKDVTGTHSTAELAKLLRSPVVLVVDVRKVTRTVGALVNGCRSFDPEVNITGVILDRVAGQRHGSIIKAAVEQYCALPVLGMIPTLAGDAGLIPGRHLGLIPPAEFDADKNLFDRLAELAENHLDIDALLTCAMSAGDLEAPEVTELLPAGDEVRIGYFNDSVFTFYYPENLEALENEGARLTVIDSLKGQKLPDIDALYIGGGFPETHSAQLSENDRLLRSVREKANGGLPIYAECGGLIYLSRSLLMNDRTYPMAGVFPIDLQMQERPAGHGYTELRADCANPYYAPGTVLRGHEFHYTAPVESSVNLNTCLSVHTGVGVGQQRDGLVHKNTLAAYTHIHALGVPEWAPALVKRAREYRLRRSQRQAGECGIDSELETNDNCDKSARPQASLLSG
ncbi:MAG: cobyrinate a,c-diamide synthase [Candidatus Zixiibacteriota bacterium]